MIVDPCRTPSAPLIRYDPWRDLADRWPEITVVLEVMPGRLLGELRYPVIALRAGTSGAQRRCTLAHEIVHLERGTGDAGPWNDREERHVHAEAARRLITVDDLASAVYGAGGTADLAAVAQALDVDQETLRVRLDLLNARERSVIRGVTAGDLWSVA